VMVLAPSGNVGSPDGSNAFLSAALTRGAGRIEESAMKITKRVLASLTFIPGGPVLSRPSNLATNGSFEVGAAMVGSPVDWATGTAIRLFAVPGG